MKKKKYEVLRAVSDDHDGCACIKDKIFSCRKVEANPSTDDGHNDLQKKKRPFALEQRSIRSVLMTGACVFFFFWGGNMQSRLPFLVLHFDSHKGSATEDDHRGAQVSAFGAPWSCASATAFSCKNVVFHFKREGEPGFGLYSFFFCSILCHTKGLLGNML